MRTYKVCKTGTPSGNSHVCSQKIQFEKKSLRKPMGMTKMNGPPQTCPSSHYMNRDCYTPMMPLAQDTIFKNPTGFPQKNGPIFSLQRPWGLDKDEKFIGLNYALSIVLQPELKRIELCQKHCSPTNPTKDGTCFPFCMLRFEKPKSVSDIAKLRSIIRVAQLIAVNVAPVSLPNRILHKCVVRFQCLMFASDIVDWRRVIKDCQYNCRCVIDSNSVQLHD